MAVKDDYIMWMIEDMARVLARLILGKRFKRESSIWVKNVA